MILGAAWERLVRHEVLPFAEDTDRDADEFVVRYSRSMRCVILAPTPDSSEGEGRRVRPVAGIAVRDAGGA